MLFSRLPSKEFFIGEAGSDLAGLLCLSGEPRDRVLDRFVGEAESYLAPNIKFSASSFMKRFFTGDWLTSAISLCLCFTRSWSTYHSSSSPLMPSISSRIIFWCIVIFYFILMVQFFSRSS
jgi:hypothetical protein